MKKEPGSSREKRRKFGFFATNGCLHFNALSETAKRVAVGENKEKQDREIAVTAIFKLYYSWQTSGAKLAWSATMNPERISHVEADVTAMCPFVGYHHGAVCLVLQTDKNYKWKQCSEPTALCPEQHVTHAVAQLIAGNSGMLPTKEERQSQIVLTWV